MKLNQMSGRERWMSALLGKPVDRIPNWLLSPLNFDPTENFTNHFALDWKMDSRYRKMMTEFSGLGLIDEIRQVSIYPFNRYLLIPQKFIENKTVIQKDSVTMERAAVVHTPHGDLFTLSETKRGVNTGWATRYPVQSLADLQKLASVPFEIDYNEIDRNYQQFDSVRKKLGDNGIVRTFLSSPIVTISGCMSFELFLELSYLEKDYILELLNMITDRYIQVLTAIFEKYDYDAIFWFGGSEQCTPPMMNPLSWDEFVLPFDKKLVDFLKSRGKYAGCHCHGKIRHALECMIRVGYQATDPVEPPPQGDLTIDEALEISGGRLTLIGNFEFDELENRDSAYLVNRTLEIMKHKDKRIILGASAIPISRLSDRLIDNYYAVMNTYKNYYEI